MAAPTPRMHGLTHVPGGSDPIPGLTVGGSGLAGLILATPGLAGFWPLNEAAGATTAVDVSGGGHDLSSAGFTAPTFGSTPIVGADTSAAFTGGTVMRLKNATFPALGSTDFTAIMFFRRTGTSTDTLIGQGDGVASGNAGWMLGVEAFNENAGNRLYVLKGAPADSLEGSLPVWAAAETHLAAVTFVQTTSTWTLYLDGVNVGSEADTFTAAGGVYVGASNPPSTSQVPDGDLAYAAAFTRALSAAEILGFYNAAFDGPATAADLSAKVDRDAVEAATNRLVQAKLAAGDTQPAFRIGGDGKLSWGPGGTTAPDTTLSRTGAAALKANGELRAAGILVANDGAANQLTLYNNGGIYWGPGFDTVLYRPVAGTLQIDGTMTAKRLSGYAGADIAVAANAVTVTAGMHRITSNPGAANLNTITAGTDGVLLMLANATGAPFNIVTGGNILMSTSPFAFPHLQTRLLVYNAQWGLWLLVGA